MGKPTNFLEEDDDFFTDDEGSGPADHDHKVKEVKRVPSRAARQRLDSRSEELWLKRQLSDWDDNFDDDARAD